MGFGKCAPQKMRPRQDLNLRTRLRRPVLYPLSYWGLAVHRIVSFHDCWPPENRVE